MRGRRNSTMATWVSDYPGEMLWLRKQIGQPLSGWRPRENWSLSPAGADDAYLSDNARRLRDQANPQDEMLTIGDGIARLRSILSAPGGVIRLTGLSGTGKTRLLEALFDPSVGDHPLDPALAVYVDIGKGAPKPSVAQLAEQLAAEAKRTILLMDNCPQEAHDAIVPFCTSVDSPISLITVDLDICDEQPEDTKVFRLRNASEAVIESLLVRRFPDLSEPAHRRIAEFSGGNTRIAILCAQHVGPEANLASLGDEQLFNNLFHQRKQNGDSLLQAAEALSLVYSFGGETGQGELAELPFLAQLVGLEPQAVQRAVGELKRREIIQSRGCWWAILPQPLANRLTKRALDNLSAFEVADGFLHCGNPRLLKSFTRRLSYLHDSEQARQIAIRWLQLGGALSNLREMAQTGRSSPMELVSDLAPLAPSAALHLIERLVQGSTLDQLTDREFPLRGRVMLLLRKLAWFPEHFRRAVLLLSCFTEAELTTSTHNANGKYLERLFWLRLSGTRADTQQRLAMVDELLSTQDSPAFAPQSTAGHSPANPLGYRHDQTKPDKAHAGTTSSHRSDPVPAGQPASHQPYPVGGTSLHTV